MRIKNKSYNKKIQIFNKNTTPNSKLIITQFTTILNKKIFIQSTIVKQ